MYKIAKFEKVSFEQFKKDYIDCFNEEDESKIKEIYDLIKLPKRATKGSAGYDFYSPITFALKPCEIIKIPTGIRVKIEDGWFLANFPRSSLGFKYRLQLNNTVGIIDADYYNALNEGHIMSKLTNDSKENKSVTIEQGSAFCQGIFLPFGITVDDDSNEVRTGGFGSTTK
jgi:dUTP pyrophosphatase